eukprot:c17207_g1_i1.p2 GENE.c17207_g1_i1~~c17207_g1_i1.p2  ORF type:complete len:226 (-),score=31.45 c17207_g1_i1:1360-2010(-)
MSRSMVLALLMLSCCLLIASGPAMGQTVPVCTDPTKFNQTLETSLLSSTDMVPHIVALQAAVPINVLWTFLSTGDLASWNPLFNQVQTASLSLCGALSASYSNGAFLADVLPDVQISAPHWIVQFGCDAAGDTCALGYFFTATIVSSQELVVFGRHTWELYNKCVLASLRERASCASRADPAWRFVFRVSVSQWGRNNDRELVRKGRWPCRSRVCL